MDDDELVLILCTRLGMLMEDYSVPALTLRALAGSDRGDAVQALANAVDCMRALIEAAAALQR